MKEQMGLFPSPNHKEHMTTGYPVTSSVSTNFPSLESCPIVIAKRKHKVAVNFLTFT
jgi:hypothetical protein